MAKEYTDEERLDWCLQINTKTFLSNGLPTHHAPSSRVAIRSTYWWHRNNPEDEFETARDAIDAAMSAEEAEEPAE